LRSPNIKTRQKSAEEVVRAKLPSGLTLKIEPIHRGVLMYGPGFGERILYYKSIGKPWGSSERDPQVGCDVNIFDDSNRMVAQVRVRNSGYPLIRHDGNHLELAKTLASALKREALYVLTPSIIDTVDDPRGARNSDV
jgi:hypothetical protein